jgi:Ser/Thr protein kinase RdoA (MazF antagonist)
LWRLETMQGVYCLRAWPPGQDEAPLRSIQAAQQRAAQALPFVPRVLCTREGASWVRAAGRLWELSTWQPGVADFHRQPTPPRLRAAVIALAEIHAVWRPDPTALGVPGAVLKRWEALSEETAEPATAAPAGSWSQRAWEQWRRWRGPACRALEPWLVRRFPLQTCLCDIWHDHVLFTGACVTGVVDFGAVRTDHVAADLARLLGSLAGDDAELRETGWTAYAGQRPFSAEERALAELLDWTGIVAGTRNLLRWLASPRIHAEYQEGLTRRLALHVTRMESWPGAGLRKVVQA